MTRSFTFLFIAAVLGLTVLFSCASQKNKNNTEIVEIGKNQMGLSSPPAIVYKTKEDYAQLVPVILSADKKKIVSFPAQSDIRINDNFPYPDALEDGYWLDNRGINKHAAFLKFSYEDYYNMDNIPTAERLMNYIADDDPFIEMYEVGRRGQFKNLVEDINQMIREGKLTEMKNLLDK